MRKERASRTGQAGLSLVEVLVYLSISGIVLAILTLALRNMNKGLVDGTRVVRLQQGAREALGVMTRDLRNAGLKQALYRDASGAWRDTLVSSVANSASDSSSFLQSDAGRYDGVDFRQLRLDANGRPQGVGTVTYRVDASRQMLTRKVDDGPFQDLYPGVDALQFQYGLYAMDSAVIQARPPGPGWASSGSVALVLSSTRMAMVLAGAGSGTARYGASGFDVVQARTYRLDIIASSNAGFFLNNGRMSVQILSPAGAVLASAPFIPGLSQTRRSVEITAPNASGCRLAIGLSATGPAQVRIASVRFGPLDRGGYTWVNDPSAAQRKTVRAVRIMMMAKTSGEGSGVQTGAYAIGNAMVPIRDQMPRRYFEEEIPIVNNGMF